MAQIKRRLQGTTYPHIDVSDLSAHGPEQVEQARLTRALAAFILTKVAGLSDEDAAWSVTDGPDDNGMDAIAFVDSETPRLYVVQAKWSEIGNKGQVPMRCRPCVPCLRAGVRYLCELDNSSLDRALMFETHEGAGDMKARGCSAVSRQKPSDG